MGKEQSNQFRMELSGNILAWKRGDLVVDRLDLAKIPGALETMARGGVVGGAVLLGISTRAKNAMAIPLDGRTRADVDREKLSRLRAMLVRLESNDWTERGETQLYVALQRLAARGSAAAQKYIDQWVGLDAATREKLGQSRTVQDEILTMRRERDAANADEDLIADLPEAQSGE